MHIPDARLCPYTCIACFFVALPLWVIASKKSNEFFKTKYSNLFASIGSAFAFSVMMFNIPIQGGTTGHAIGAALLSIVFGPWVAAMLVTIALLAQALLFGDGGITTFAANSLIIAFIPSFVGYCLFNLLNKTKSDNMFIKSIFAGISGYISICFASLIAGVLLGLQPLLNHDPSGKALYFFYPLSVSVSSMFFEHISVFGWVEMIVTSVVYGLLNLDSAFVSQFLMKKENYEINK
jgi:cobalt/nickel transport system permease protein